MYATYLPIFGFPEVLSQPAASGDLNKILLVESMKSKPKILFLASQDAWAAATASELLSSFTGDTVECRAALLTREASSPIDSVLPVSELDEVPLDLVITLCADSRDLCTGENAGAHSALISGLPAFLHWNVPSSSLVDRSAAHSYLADRIRDLVETGTLSAIRLSRARLQALADMMNEGMIIHDAQRRIFLVNQAVLEMTGSHPGDILGQDCHCAFPPEGLCGASCQFKTGSASEHAHREYQVQFLSRDGEIRHLQMTSEPVQIDEDHPGVLALVRDVTEVTVLRSRVAGENNFHGIVGASRIMHEVFGTIRSAAATDYPILISGESGTGKELVAVAIHRESSRRDQAFVPINCGALPESILESELFGHVRGAFTGALRDKKGRFELAHRGTLFLDEIGELTPAFQVKLLRVLQEKSFERVGGEKPVTVDVRLIGATNRDLRKMVAEGTFREDLYYRIAVVPVRLPPLRERREDIPLLLEDLLSRISEESGRPRLRLNREAMTALLTFSWPGNVREMLNALQFASIRAQAGEIRLEDLPQEVAGPRKPGLSESRDGFVGQGFSLIRQEAVTRDKLLAALAQAGGNRSKAAQLLGIGRATLYRHLNKLEED